jgi:CHAT domain-containing protein
MLKILLLVFIFGLLIISFSQERVSYDHNATLAAYVRADEDYKKAEALSSLPDFNDETEKLQENLYLESLKRFEALLPALERSHDDSLLFFSFARSGLILHFFDSLPAAMKYYQRAIDLKENLISIQDSFVFRPYLFSGTILYSRNEFDSALLYYKKAEQIQERYTLPLKDAQRLYNLLGVMYYETGNYGQARNYFEKAIALLSPTDNYYKDLFVNYKINIGSMLIKLEEYDEANSVYQSILPYRLYTNEIVHNIGIINQKLGASSKAIKYFKQADYGKSKKNIDLFYNLGVAYADLQQGDSSHYYIQKAIAENASWYGDKKSVLHGLILKFDGDQLAKEKNYKASLENYQLAIVQFYSNFNSADIYENPGEYTGSFSYINLFNTLSAKADAFEKLFSQEKNDRYLTASLDAYRSAFRLADYVEKTYASDEARLFLNKIKYLVHSKPIGISLLLYAKQKDEKYLEEAYLFDQRNKASILSLNAQENELRKHRGSIAELLDKESSLRATITRLSLRAAQFAGGELEKLNASIRDNEIQLGRIQDKINADPVYGNSHFRHRIPSSSEVQKKLDRKTALLSYHLSGDELLIIVLTGRVFDCVRLPITKDFFTTIDSCKLHLGDVNTGRYNGTHVASTLYKMLVASIHPKLKGIDRLIIIPDDELNYLPFEALQNEKGKYLVEEFSVQYLYSTAMLELANEKKLKENIIAFAPFASQGFIDSSGVQLSILPASKEEVADLKGKVLADADARKDSFVRNANHYGILHLATHASINNKSPQRSFIAFYPGNYASDDYKLYAQEIYDMQMDSTQMIILSACETGTGQLIKGEGLMSLSRAFAYAGCPNIITSLWKAEDKTTAFLTRRMYHYLDKGLSRDKALQKAKTDLLQTAEIDPRFKAPNYWAHLVFIGQYEPAKTSGSWWLIGGIILLAGVILLFMSARRKGRVLGSKV